MYILSDVGCSGVQLLNCHDDEDDEKYDDDDGADDDDDGGSRSL